MAVEMNLCVESVANFFKYKRSVKALSVLLESMKLIRLHLEVDSTQSGLLELCVF